MSSHSHVTGVFGADGILADELVAELVALAAEPSTTAATTAAAASSTTTTTTNHANSSHFTRRGLLNYQNTCFLNCILQCLLHCPEFWSYAQRLHAILTEPVYSIDPHLTDINESTIGAGEGQQVNHKQINKSSQSVPSSSCHLSRTIPITHELIAFAAHFRRIPKEPLSTSTHEQTKQLPSDASLLNGSVATTAPTISTDKNAVTVTGTSSVSGAVIETPATSISTPATVDQPTSTNAASILPPPINPPPSDSSNSTNKSTPSGPKKKKKSKAEKDDAFLDSLIAPTYIDPLEEEEKRKARNRKKKEKERERAAKLKAEKDQARDGDVEEKKMESELQQLHLASPITTSTISSSSASTAVDAQSSFELSNRQKKKLKVKSADASVNEITTEIEPAAVESGPPTESEQVSDAISPLATASSAFVSKKNARVHRVEDEEEWTLPIPNKPGKKKPQPTFSTAAPPKPKGPVPNIKSPSTNNGTSPPNSTTVTTAPSVLGLAPTTQPFLPSFPALLRAFHAHRQGQQEDAQELLQILCENIQSEWTSWSRSWKHPFVTPTFSSQTTTASGEDDWNEVGKGSKAIKVVSNLAFAPSPLSRIFCGRVRTQLSVASRNTDTMSFQPFYALHLDIDDDQPQPQSDAYLPPSTGAKSKHRKHRKPMTVERALERYMCPSEITGYKKSSAAPSYIDEYGYSQPATTRALHMHALDSHALPRIMVLHLKRFEQSGHMHQGRPQLVKNSKHVQFSSHLPIPARYLSTSAASSIMTNLGASYTLIGVVVHHGHSMAGGHYTAYVRDRSQEKTNSAKPMPSSSATSSSSKKSQPPVKRPPSHLNDSDDESNGEDDSKSTSASVGSTSHSPTDSSEIWYHCDDARITPVPAHTVYQQLAYILFYTLDQV